MKRSLSIAALVLLALPAAAFDFGNLGDIGKGVGVITKTADNLKKADEDLTPVQQYYLGRAFGATILESRKPLDNPVLTQYVNSIGQALVLASDQPATYNGYRFLILDTPEVNAFSGPGGFVFVTKGLIQLTSNEAELAAVLAHEVSHVALQHGVKAIKKDRQTGALITGVADTAKTLGSADMAKATDALQGSVTDLTKNIVNNGYSRDTEFEADAHAVEVLRNSGYSPQALLAMLEDLKKIPQGSGSSLSKTHPAPADRIAKVKPLVQKDGPVTLTDVQKQRYQAAVGSL